MISTKTKNRWDYYNVIDGAKILAEHDNTVKIATNLKAMGLSAEDIEKATGPNVEDIKEL